MMSGEESAERSRLLFVELTRLVDAHVDSLGFEEAVAVAFRAAATTLVYTICKRMLRMVDKQPSEYGSRAAVGDFVMQYVVKGAPWSVAIQTCVDLLFEDEAKEKAAPP